MISAGPTLSLSLLHALCCSQLEKAMPEKQQTIAEKVPPEIALKEMEKIHEQVMADCKKSDISLKVRAQDALRDACITRASLPSRLAGSQPPGAQLERARACNAPLPLFSATRARPCFGMVALARVPAPASSARPSGLCGDASYMIATRGMYEAYTDAPLLCSRAVPPRGRPFTPRPARAFHRCPEISQTPLMLCAAHNSERARRACVRARRLQELVAITKGLEAKDPMINPGVAMKWENTSKKGGGCAVM